MEKQIKAQKQEKEQRIKTAGQQRSKQAKKHCKAEKQKADRGKRKRTKNKQGENQLSCFSIFCFSACLFFDTLVVVVFYSLVF